MFLLKKSISNNINVYIMSIVFAISGVISNIFTYIILAGIIASLISGGEELAFYTKRVIYIFLLFCLREIFDGISTTISHTATFKSLRDIRKELSEKLFKMSLGNIYNIGAGRLKDIFIDKVDNMETTLAHIVPEMTANIVGPIILLIYMAVLNWKLTIMSIIPLIIALFILKATLKNYPEKYAKSVKIGQNMNSSIIEYINGIEVIKTFNQGEKSYKKYSDAVYENATYYYNWMKENNLSYAISLTIAPMGILFIIPFGIRFYINGAVSLEALITIIILSFGTISNILKVMSFEDDIARIKTITSEIEMVLNARELNHAIKPVEINDYTVEFNDVDFSYNENKKIIKNLNLKIKEKETTAFVGPSGGGKSTIIKLLAGFWDVNDGCIKIGGVKIEDIPLEKLSKLISYVSQDNFLFDISVRDNIRIGKPTATNEEIEDIAKRSGCDEFIRNLTNGYETIVGDSGSYLSGGERQRIAIARAMLKDSPIVILDEATSYIDPENESIIQEAIGNLVKGKTLIMIAHRLRTITDVDTIYVVDKGEIVDSGEHSELLKKSKIYIDMWNAAIKGDE